MEDQNIEDWESLFHEEFKKADRQNRFIEIGKLGGRPKLSAPKSERLALRFTVSEMKILKEKAEKEALSSRITAVLSFLKKNFRTMKKISCLRSMQQTSEE